MVHPMHELSVAYNLVESATAAAQAAGASRIVTVNLRLGALSGVVEDALRFGFDVAARGTLAEGATLAVETAPARVACAGCGADGVLADLQWVRCPACGSARVVLSGGRELELVNLEVDV
jgi:hydrogenase nickel incorporation protein HypA/HybF